MRAAIRCKVGDVLVFIGDKSFVAQAGARVVVTRAPYTNGLVYVDVVWADALKNGQHDGRYETRFFRPVAKILPFKR
jgi:hypothetical protein